MFKVSTTPTYWAPVPLEIRDAKGKLQKYPFDAEFKRLTRAEIDAIPERLKTGDLDDEKLIREVLVGWKGVQDEEGNALAFTDDNLTEALSIAPVLPALIDAFFNSVSSGRRKN